MFGGYERSHRRSHGRKNARPRLGPQLVPVTREHAPGVADELARPSVWVRSAFVHAWRVLALDKRHRGTFRGTAVCQRHRPERPFLCPTRHAQEFCVTQPCFIVSQECGVVLGQRHDPPTPRPIQIPQSLGTTPGCGMLLLQAEQNGKRLAAKLAGWGGWTPGKGGQGSETGEERAARRGASPFPFL